MRKIEFNVPQDVVVEFCECILDTCLANKVIGTTEDNGIVLEVSYEKEESKAIDELEKQLEELCQGLESEEEEETED